MPMKTPRQRADEKREEKLAAIKEQIDDGSLTVRKRTAGERKAHPPQPRPASGRGSKRGFR